MIDISKIADAIINLINSNMRSPRKDEIEAVLREHIDSGVPTSGGYSGVSTDGWVAVVGNNNYASNATPPLPADCGNPIFSIFPQPHPDDTIVVTVSGPADDTLACVLAAEAYCRTKQGEWVATWGPKNCDRDGHQFSVRDVCDRCGTTLLDLLGQPPKI